MVPLRLIIPVRSDGSEVPWLFLKLTNSNLRPRNYCQSVNHKIGALSSQEVAGLSSNVSTYQAGSGAGQIILKNLIMKHNNILMVGNDCKFSQSRERNIMLAFNLLPQIDVFRRWFYSEKWKMVQKLRRLCQVI